MPIVPLKLNQAGSLAVSVNENQPDFQEQLAYTDSTLNMSSGINEGIGPRYGMAPIPRHSDTDALSTIFLCPGLMLAETAFSQPVGSTSARTKVMAIYTLRFGGFNSSVKTISTYYLWVLGYTDSNFAGLNLLDVFPSSTQSNATSFGICQQSPNITDGFFRPIVSDPGAFECGIWSQYVAGQQNSASQKLTNTATLQSTALINFLSTAAISVSGPAVPMQWLIGTTTSPGDATHAPSSTFSNESSVSGANFFQGVPPSYIYGNFNTNQRTLFIYAINSDGTENIVYTVNVPTPSTSIFKPSTYLDLSNVGANIDLSSLTAIKVTSGTSYSDSVIALYNDPLNTCASSYQAILISGSKPHAVIIQDWYRDAQGRLQQYFDLVNAPSEPTTVNSSRYVEGVNPEQVSSCFNSWPEFIPGTAMVANVPLGTALGAADTGLLRANTVYQFSYSKYNKRLNFESNVGQPIQFQTGTDDFVSLIISSPNDGSSSFEVLNTSFISVLPSPMGAIPTTVAGDNPDYLNYLEYRFYYRQAGMEVWLPALQVDAANWWFNPSGNPFVACTGGIGGTPGGEGGAFQDYSRLPQDNYTCVVMYKNRAFWLSDKALVFSLTNNIFAYPARNSAGCPTGSFKGALVQAYYGQATQDARLVIFSNGGGTFVGKFTGQPQVTSLTLDTADPPTVAQFPLDGSDFVINTWTSVEAFSYRSAVVAEGLLFFWGPQGIFLDDGVNPIQRISVPIEPQIFNLYDTSQTDSICCEYNDTTKEIIWFFPPKVADASFPTYGLLYNKLKNQFLPLKFRGQVDAAQGIHIDQGIPTAGTRMMIMSRASAAAATQRAYFFDQNNLACDIYPGAELMVSAVSSPTTSTRLLTLAAGHSTGTISVGDFIALQQCAAYTNGALANPADFIAKVTAVGSGNLTVQVPTGVVFDASATISTDLNYFPIWHVAGNGTLMTGNGINGFPWVLDTKFWIPNGMSYWAYWLYLHLVYKLYDLLPSPIALQHLLTYQTPITGTPGTSMLTLTNNSANNCQIFHALPPGQQAFEGQGIKLTFSGIQLASSWILQFLESMSQFKDGQQLKIFEG